MLNNEGLIVFPKLFSLYLKKNVKFDKFKIREDKLKI